MSAYETTAIHYLDGFLQHTNNLRIHYVKQTWFFDVQGSYNFGFGETAETWKRLLNRATLTLGCTNVFGHDPPRSNSINNYAAFTYDSTGRFVFVSLKKEL